MHLNLQNLLKKLTFYSQKYGFLQAVFSFLGRYYFPVWQSVGPVISRQYVYKWFKENSYHILNLGGGSNCINGCLTVDISPRADAYVDLTKPLPFKDSSFDAIFCEEAIEHIELEDAQRLLRECFRVLKTNGILRITTPDLDYFTEKATESVEACSELNNIFYEHGHRYLYSRQALQYYCLNTGFTNLVVSSYKDTKTRLGYLDSHADRFSHSPLLSQYLEMQKLNI